MILENPKNFIIIMTNLIRDAIVPLNETLPRCREKKLGMGKGLMKGTTETRAATSREIYGRGGSRARIS